MRLDVAAQRALHVLPPRNDPRAAASTSAYGILNRTRTAMGKRLLRSWLKQPLTSVDAIAERHAVVAAFVDDPEMRCALVATGPKNCNWSCCSFGGMPCSRRCCHWSAGGLELQSGSESEEARLQVADWCHCVDLETCRAPCMTRREAVRGSHLRGVCDVQRLARKLAASKIDLKELCQLYMASNQLPALADALRGHDGAPFARWSCACGKCLQG